MFVRKNVGLKNKTITRKKNAEFLCKFTESSTLMPKDFFRKNLKIQIVNSLFYSIINKEKSKILILFEYTLGFVF